VTTGGTTGTTGGKTGTSGGGTDWPAVGMVALVSLAIAVLNATSNIMEAESKGEALDARVPWVLEISSIIVVVALAPFIGWMVRKFPPADGRWARFVGAHVVAATVFSAVHIIGMVLLRKLAYATAGQDYVFADPDGMLRPLFYEWRKDLLSYAGIAFGYWALGFWRAQQAALAMAARPASDARIEIRDGSRVVLVEPAEIAWVEAAGNYVEVHARGATHLVRGTLAAFEAKLTARGFVRIHRSRLVNRARVKAFKPTQSGDLEITLDDDYVIMGSRRFRAAMESA
jgi:DNA-binding LytR/AlgR family response regulator